LSRTRLIPIHILLELLILAVVGLLFAVSFIFLRPRSAVDWTAAKAVVIESDDWGFCGFIPDLERVGFVDIAAIEPGNFPRVYNHSTLETAADVTRMARLLMAHEGRDGLPVVFQPNYIMAALSYEPADGDGSWRRTDLPDLPADYDRPELWTAVEDAVRAGVWWPEYHGLWHYNPDHRRAVVAVNAEAARAAGAGLLFFPGMARSFELSRDRDPEVLAAELGEGLAIFESLFGRRPYSVIAPDYAWDHRRELMWLDGGVRIVQAKREQRSLTKLGASTWDRMSKVGERSWRHLTERRISYLNRNCRLEGAQTEDAAQHADICLDNVKSAWYNGEPAIIGTHRVNYAHLDSASAEIGFNTLAYVLETLGEKPDERPLYLTDHEVAQLMRDGTSARDTGDRVFLRNLTHSRRPVLLPGRDGEAPRIFWLAPRTSQAVVLPDYTVD